MNNTPIKKHTCPVCHTSKSMYPAYYAIDESIIQYRCRECNTELLFDIEKTWTEQFWRASRKLEIAAKN